MKVNVNKIIVKDRLREVVIDEYIDELAKSIEKIGLLHNIVINTDYELIAGAHRLTAIKSLKWEEVEVKMIDKDLILNQLQEVEENLAIKKLNPFELSEFRNKQKELYEELNPKSTKKYKVSNNLSKKDEEKVDSFVENTAKKTGKSTRTIQKELSILKNMKNNDLVEELVKITDLSDINAVRISQLDEDNQNELYKSIKTLKEEKGKVKNIDLISMNREPHVKNIKKNNSNGLKDKILNQAFKLVKSIETDDYLYELDNLKELVNEHNTL